MVLIAHALVVETSDFLNHFGLTDRAFSNWLHAVEETYNDHPYHNALHGADVAQTVFYFITTAGLGLHMEHDVRFAAILAATVTTLRMCSIFCHISSPPLLFYP